MLGDKALNGATKNLVFRAEECSGDHVGITAQGLAILIWSLAEPDRRANTGGASIGVVMPRRNIQPP